MGEKARVQRIGMGKKKVELKDDTSIAAAISGFDPQTGPGFQAELERKLQGILTFVAQHCQRVPGGEMIVTYTPKAED